MNEEPIRVLHVVRYLEQGGIQNLLLNLYRKIDKSQIQFDFLVSGKGFFDDEVKSLGGIIYTIPYISDIGVNKYQKELEKFFKEHKEYKIVHCHLNQLSGVVLESAKKCNIPVRIAHAHTTKNTNNIIAKIYKSYLQKKINPNATHLFSCSEEAARWMFGKRASEAQIINNGIDAERFIYSEEKNNSIRKELGINEDTVVVGHIGRFSKVKNHEFLLQIFEEYNKINANSVLLLIGAGELLENIKNQAKELGINDKVKFLGNRMDVDYLYSTFNCYVFPSLYEGISLTLIEAQCSGCNIIASDTVDKATDITGTINFKNLLETPKKWAEEIENTNFFQRNKKGEQVKNTKYNINVGVKEITNFYESVLNKTNGEM